MNNSNLGGADFGNYRVFLAEHLRALKAIDAKFSHRYVNRRVGARSAGWLADVLAGRQNLKPRHVAPLAEALRLEGGKRELLRALVDIESAEAVDTREAAYARLLALKGIAAEDVDRDRVRYFDHWYYPVLRELLLLIPFDGDHAALGARLAPPITARQARQAVATLRRLGLLNPGTRAPMLVKQPGSPAHWAKLVKTYSALAQQAVLNYGREERDFSALIVPLSPEGLKAAGEEIAGLRRRLLAIAARDTGTPRVYQALFQVFPLSVAVPDGEA